MPPLKTSRCQCRVDAIQPSPAKLCEQAVQAIAHPSDIRVVANPRLQRCTFDPRLVRVNFPGMKVEDARRVIALRCKTHVLYGKAIWKQPEKTTAAAWPRHSKPPHRRNRNFDEFTPGERMKRELRCLGNIARRIEAGTVAVSGPLQHSVNPDIAFIDRK